MKKILILLLTLSSCAYGPTEEKKSVLNYLNGEHYNKSAQVMGVPVVERKIKLTTISGKIQVDDPFAKMPKNVEVVLFNKDKIITATSTSAFGTFKLEGSFPNDLYILKAITPHFKGEVSIKIDSYNISDAIITLYKSPDSLE